MKLARVRNPSRARSGFDEEKSRFLKGSMFLEAYCFSPQSFGEVFSSLSERESDKIPSWIDPDSPLHFMLSQSSLMPSISTPHRLLSELMICLNFLNAAVAFFKLTSSRKSSQPTNLREQESFCSSNFLVIVINWPTATGFEAQFWSRSTQTRWRAGSVIFQKMSCWIFRK